MDNFIKTLLKSGNILPAEKGHGYPIFFEESAQGSELAQAGKRGHNFIKTFLKSGNILPAGRDMGTQYSLKSRHQAPKLKGCGHIF